MRLRSLNSYMFGSRRNRKAESLKFGFKRAFYKIELKKMKNE